MRFMLPSANPYGYLEAMYPDVYSRVYPEVKKMCDKYDIPSNTSFYPRPSREAVEQMADSIYQGAAPELEIGLRQRRRGFLRPLILILLIRELLRRRRRRRFF